MEKNNNNKRTYALYVDYQRLASTHKHAQARMYGTQHGPWQQCKSRHATAPCASTKDPIHHHAHFPWCEHDICIIGSDDDGDFACGLDAEYLCFSSSSSSGNGLTDWTDCLEEHSVPDEHAKNRAYPLCNLSSAVASLGDATAMHNGEPVFPQCVAGSAGFIYDDFFEGDNGKCQPMPKLTLPPVDGWQAPKAHEHDEDDNHDDDNKFASKAHEHDEDDNCDDNEFESYSGSCCDSSAAVSRTNGPTLRERRQTIHHAAPSDSKAPRPPRKRKGGSGRKQVVRTRVLFPAHIKQLLDEALIDKIFHPQEWRPIYHSGLNNHQPGMGEAGLAPVGGGGSLLSPKFTALMESTGLTEKQIKQYMHNNARRGMRIAVALAKERQRDAFYQQQ